MDLSRAKTVLIAAFFLLNVFLFYYIWQEEAGSMFAFGQQAELSQLEAALETANLEMAVTLPRGGIRIGHLVVEPWEIEHKAAVTPVWEALGIQLETDPENLTKERFWSELEEERVIISRYSEGNYKLLIREQGVISLSSSLHELPGEEAARDEIEEAAEALVAAIPYLGDFELDYVQKGQEWLVFNYRQLYQGFPLYAGYLQVFMQGMQPAGFYLYRLNPQGFAEQEREIIPPSTALLRFLEGYARGSREKTIIDFSLGYYSQEYDAERWEIPPVWRIRLNNGEVYYINAFTGQLER